jgi:ParB-like chromosome segregation protein Spo0J
MVDHTIEFWPVASLKPFDRNSRRHSREQVAQIAASIREFGFTIPVLIAPDGTLIAGHGRVLAAAEIGLEDIP